MSIERLGYNGNANLKRKDTRIEWTQELVAEYVKCAKDVVYFAEKYIQIVHVDHGLIPIALYDYQKEIIEKLKEYQGEYLKITYKERYTTFFWWGDTKYFITDVQSEHSPIFRN